MWLRNTGFRQSVLDPALSANIGDLGLDEIAEERCSLSTGVED